MNLDLFNVSTQAFGWLGPWTLIAMLAAHWMRMRPKMKELQDNADGSLRRDLMAEIAALRAEAVGLRKEAADERADCNRRIEALEQMAFGKGSTSTLHGNGATP